MADAVNLKIPGTK